MTKFVQIRNGSFVRASEVTRVTTTFDPDQLDVHVQVLVHIGHEVAVAKDGTLNLREIPESKREAAISKMVAPFLTHAESIIRALEKC